MALDGRRGGAASFAISCRGMEVPGRRPEKRGLSYSSSMVHSRGKPASLALSATCRIFVWAISLT